MSVPVSYVALLDGGKRERTVRVTPLGPGLFEVRIGQVVHRVDAYRHDYGTLSMLVDGDSYSATLDERGASVHVRLDGSVFPIEILDERKLRLRRAAGTFTVEGKQTVTAPMPGKVVKVLVAPGAEVRQGQALLCHVPCRNCQRVTSPVWPFPRFICFPTIAAAACCC